MSLNCLAPLRAFGTNLWYLTEKKKILVFTSFLPSSLITKQQVAMDVPVVGAVIDSIVGSSVENLISLLKKEFSLITGVEKDVEKLISVLSTIQAVLEDAEEQQINNKPISDWLRKLKDATYDAEDVLDVWALKIQERNEMEAATTSSTSLVSRSLPSSLNPKNIRFRHKIAKQIQKVISKFNEIADEQKFHLKPGSVIQDTSESQYSKQRRETSSVATGPHIYGAEENVTKIIDILENTFVNEDDVSVCPIVGMGGLGKTTLAQTVYNDERVKKHFELKFWVCVSEPFDVKRILEAITETSTPGTLEAVRKKVEEILWQKRYLIVLDDVWNENQDKWDELKSYLKGGAKGSSVVLTTRLLTVASITRTIEEYNLGALSDDDCFSLFKHHALGDRGEALPPNLADIGKHIAKKCKGVPLAAKSLGSLLWFKTSEKQWESVRDSEIWTLDETGENRIMAVLRLSYNHLSSRLKQCFAYCAIFPKDFVMAKSKLINLWIANGFIQCQGNMELEEVGDDVFNELLRLSFFQEPKTDQNITTCKMHDLMHDLASGVANKECFIANVGETKDIPKTIRHLSVVCDSQTDVVDHLFSPPLSLRTLYFFHSIDFHRVQFSSTLRVLNLRVLNLRVGGIQTLPPSICDLIHLRYLDLSSNFHLVSLPESIHKLRNLLMLNLSWNQRLGALPLSLCKLKCLRHLNLSWCKSITSLPEGLGSMRSLRHLDLSWCNSITSLPEGLESLSSLRHLDLSLCSSITSLPEGLESLSSLRHLNLSCCSSITSLPEGLGSMSSLSHLNLSNCFSITSLPEGLVSMSSLSHLNLSNCFSITSLPEGLGSMSSLRHLDLSRCYSITSLPEGLGSMSSLRDLNLENVRNGEDAKEANLSSNTYVYEIRLKWDPDCEAKISEEVLEGFLWHPLNHDITSLTIQYYPAAYFPEVFQQNLKFLKSLYICACKRLKSLGCTWTQGDSNPNTSSSASSSSHFHSSSLQELSIEFCPELQFSDKDFQYLDALCELTLISLPQLTALPQGIQHLPMLRRLVIQGCENLRILKSLGCTWTQGDSNPNTSSSASSSSHFHSSSLQELSIEFCPELQFSDKDFHNLDALRKLSLRHLPQLTTLPQGIQHLPMLRRLEIWGCENLRILKCLGCTWTQGDSNPNTSSSASSSSHFHSSSLQELSIERCPELLFSEEDFQYLDALRELTLIYLPQLTALPQGIQHLPMLRRLVIQGCENLRVFPAWVVKRREKEKGEDWHFYCDNENIEFGLEEENANEPATEETTDQVNNGKNTIIELDGSATEPISDNPNIESAPDEEANEPTMEELNTNMQLNEPTTEAIEEVKYTKHIASLVSPTVVRHILLVFVIFLLPTTCY